MNLFKSDLQKAIELSKADLKRKFEDQQFICNQKIEKLEKIISWVENSEIELNDLPSFIKIFDDFPRTIDTFSMTKSQFTEKTNIIEEGT